MTFTLESQFAAVSAGVPYVELWVGVEPDGGDGGGSGGWPLVSAVLSLSTIPCPPSPIPPS